MISFLPQMAMTQTVESTSSTLAGNSSGTGSSTQPSFLEQLQGLMGTTSSSGSSTSDVNQAGLFTLMAAAGMTAASEEEMNLALQDESELFAAAEQLIENLIKALEDSREASARGFRIISRFKCLALAIHECILPSGSGRQ